MGLGNLCAESGHRLSAVTATKGFCPSSFTALYLFGPQGRMGGKKQYQVGMERWGNKGLLDINNGKEIGPFLMVTVAENHFL